jgi:hypothetical protein
VGEGSLTPTRDKCGQDFAPRESKGDFQVSKGVIRDTRGKGWCKGMGGTRKQISSAENNAHKVLHVYCVHVCRV